MAGPTECDQHRFFNSPRYRAAQWQWVAMTTLTCHKRECNTPSCPFRTPKGGFQSESGIRQFTLSFLSSTTIMYFLRFLLLSLSCGAVLAQYDYGYGDYNPVRVSISTVVEKAAQPQSARKHCSSCHSFKISQAIEYHRFRKLCTRRDRGQTMQLSESELASLS